MTSPTSSISLPRAVGTALGAVVGCLLALICTASPALAHDRLESSSPAADAKVTDLQAITLEFTSRMRFAKVVLTGPGDKPVKLGTPSEGRTVRAEVPAPLAPGRYRIAWRVLSSDGHPITGQIPFTVTAADTAGPDSTDPSPAPASPSPSPSSSSSSSSDAQPVPTETTSSAPAVPAAAPSAAAPAQSGTSGLPGWLWLLGAAAVLAGAATWLATRRKGTSGERG
ncbi:copper resistance protein CopC [Streptosporangium sp. NPDC051022]|uniref:copper resistance CopC family protein n=1 Tax=Streptosporangium sp. NPDC051022 TaxID=3155752 RepID=UPI00343DDEC8